MKRTIMKYISPLKGMDAKPAKKRKKGKRKEGEKQPTYDLASGTCHRNGQEKGGRGITKGHNAQGNGDPTPTEGKSERRG